MNKLPIHKKPFFNRRNFISNTIKLFLLGSVINPLDQSCKNKDTRKPEPPPAKPVKHSAANNTKRKKWNYEKLVMNSKSKVMHFPTSKVYAYYDEIIPNHIQEISLTAWAGQLQEPVRLNRHQSGNILEILAMQDLNKGINDSSLAAASDTLSKAFMKECDNKNNINSNSTNFRLHELMLQLIALNNNIADTDKWRIFTEKVKKPDALRKRQKWMESGTAFDERVKYIQGRRNDYINRLTTRSAKYSFT